MKLRTLLATALISTAMGCATDEPTNPNPEPCGDGTCAASESHASCPADCPASGPVCGDGACNGTETMSSCPSDCPASGPVCGDGTCNGTETTATCASDCPQAACTTSPDDCTGDTVCVAGDCVAAFGRIYKIVLVDGVMTQNNAAGSTWDLAGGLPDPKLTVTLNGTDLGTTSTKQDTLTPAWNEFVMATIPGGSTFKVSVLDDDIAADDPMFGCTNTPLTADIVRVHGAPYVQCSGTGALAAAHVRFYFLPQ